MFSSSTYSISLLAVLLTTLTPASCWIVSAYTQKDHPITSWINVYMADTNNPGYDCSTFKLKDKNVGASTLVFLATDDTSFHCNPNTQLHLYWDEGCWEPVPDDRRTLQYVENNLVAIHDGFIKGDGEHQPYKGFKINLDDCTSVVNDMKKKRGLSSWFWG